MITSKLRQELQEAGGDRYTRFQLFETRIRSLLEYSQAGSLRNFTPHGLSHITAVEQNYDWLLSDEDIRSFNNAEIFVLLCATVAHDLAMIPTQAGGEEQARKNHASILRNFLHEHLADLGIDIHEAEAIGEVVATHGVDDLNKVRDFMVLRNEELKLRKLGACLSLADLCHADSSRAPSIVFKHLSMDKESRSHWRRHIQIAGITRRDSVIIMSSTVFSPEGESAVKDYKEAIEAQLKLIKPYFSSILQPLHGVQLDIKQLDSPLDQSFAFQTNMPAILRLLIEGVYDREDVFIRELVQNSMDSCLIQRASKMRRNQSYTPQVVVTCYLAGKHLHAVRIDDNGIGMDVNDVEDTVLWIGSTISSNQTITDLVQSTFSKNLIATFGIGLLSCFKCSSKIIVRSAKEGATPISFELSTVSERVRPEKSDDASIGTTFIVVMDRTKSQNVEIDSALSHYCRQVNQVQLKTLLLEASDDLLNASRDTVRKIASTEAEDVEQYSYFPEKPNCKYLDLEGEDYSGRIWMATDKAIEAPVDGELQILSEGIYVANERTSDWLPGCLSFCEGFLNFGAKSLTLPASRDKVIKDKRFRAKVADLRQKALGIVEVLVKETDYGRIGRSTRDDRDRATLYLALIYNKATDLEKVGLLVALAELRVIKYKGAGISLREITAQNPDCVYLEYGIGNTVRTLSKVDGKQLWHKPDDLVELQATLLTQEGELVISCARQDGEGKVLLEAPLLKAYFKRAGIKVKDFTEDNVIRSLVQSSPLGADVQKALGASTKFVEVAGLPSRGSWRVGQELWINLSNPAMKKFYHFLRSRTIRREDFAYAFILKSILEHDYDRAIKEITDKLMQAQ